MDCKTLEHKLYPKAEDMPEFEVVVVYSGVTGALTDSGFNNRTDECRVAGWLLEEFENMIDPNTEVTPLDDIRLREISKDVFEKHKEKLPGRFNRRATHFYTEQDRVVEGAKAWREGDLNHFGELMFASGDSTFYQYETGIPEMKTIFDTLRATEGVYGARPSGAGFRGSVIGLIDPKYKEEIKQKIEEVYPEAHPEYADTFEVNVLKTADGASYVESLEELE